MSADVRDGCDSSWLAYILQSQARQSSPVASSSGSGDSYSALKASSYSLLGYVAALSIREAVQAVKPQISSTADGFLIAMTKFVKVTISFYFS